MTWRLEIERTLNEQRGFLLRLAHIQLRDAQWAQDVVQDTALAAWQSADHFEGRSTARTWLVGILRFKILDALRERQRQPIALSALEAEQGQGALEDELLFDAQGRWHDTPQIWWTEQGGPQDALQQSQMMRLLAQCLLQLPERTAQVFLMREYLGFNGPDIAQQTGLTAGYVRTILMRARLVLRTCLELHRPEA